MADITKAKAGEQLSDEAVANLIRLGVGHADADRTVKPKAYGTDGQWVCIDCGHPCANQIDAHNHAELHGQKVQRSVGRKRGRMTFETVVQQHRLAWRNFHTGDIEEP